jgi:nucleoside-diphosphate-sugar epimerase
MTFIVYGITGFIGRAIQATLETSGARYIGFGQQICIHKDGLGPAEENEAKTPTDRALMLKEFPAPKAVIFAAGPALATADPESLRESHVGSLREAFEILPRKWRDGLPFIYASSGLVYGRRASPRPIRESDPTAPNSIYGEIKRQCEQLLAELAARTGARCVSARLFNVTGPGHANGIVVDVARQAADIRSGLRSTFRLRSSAPILDLIDVREAAEGLVRLAEAYAPPPFVNVCSGRTLTTQDLINAARQAIGRDCPVGYDDDRGPCEALIGSPDLMVATTGWRARKAVNKIVADVIVSLEPGGGNPNG